MLPWWPIALVYNSCWLRALSTFFTGLLGGLAGAECGPYPVAPKQLAFVRAFELLCEVMGKEPSLSVFFWYFSLHQVDKVGWTSLSRQPRRKLMKPFLVVGQTGLSLLLGELGNLFSPCTGVISRPFSSWSLRTSWRTRSYSVKDIASLKARSRSTTPVVAMEAYPLSTV
ncbi:hypothetical protein CR513_24076, partial [Mucuna pruriens]